MRRLAFLVPLLATALLLAGCGGNGDEAAEPAPPLDGECAAVEAPAPRAPAEHEAPVEELSGDATLTFVTSCGSFTVSLDPHRAPSTGASLVALAEGGYFDDTIFHRVVPGFVVQGGDPTQTGAGGPGYSTVDPPPPDSRYTRGVVAMAKTELEPAGTAGSQFFVVTADDAALDPLYAIVGTVTEGMDTIDRIDALGTGGGPPSRPVVVERVTAAQ